MHIPHTERPMDIHTLYIYIHSETQTHTDTHSTIHILYISTHRDTHSVYTHA